MPSAYIYPNRASGHIRLYTRNADSKRSMPGSESYLHKAFPSWQAFKGLPQSARLSLTLLLGALKPADYIQKAFNHLKNACYILNFIVCLL